MGANAIGTAAGTALTGTDLPEDADTIMLNTHPSATNPPGTAGRAAGIEAEAEVRPFHHEIDLMITCTHLLSCGGAWHYHMHSSSWLSAVCN